MDFSTISSPLYGMFDYLKLPNNSSSGRRLAISCAWKPLRTYLLASIVRFGALSNRSKGNRNA